MQVHTPGLLVGQFSFGENEFATEGFGEDDTSTAVSDLTPRTPVLRLSVQTQIDVECV
jgi:hypothetical protein